MGGHPAPPHPFILQICVYNLFCGIFKFREDKSNNEFREILKCVRKTAKFELIGGGGGTPVPPHPFIL